MTMESGNLVIDRDGTIRGMIAGDVTVRAGCHVKLSGMIGGDVHVEPDARVKITGMVTGRVVNHGGDVRVTGMIGGR